MDTESGTKGGKVVTLVRKQDATKSEEFVAEFLSTLKGLKPEEEPTNIMIIEYIETEDLSHYNMYVGGPGRMRPHHLVGILQCLSDEVSATAGSS